MSIITAEQLDSVSIARAQAEQQIERIVTALEDETGLIVAQLSVTRLDVSNIDEERRSSIARIDMGLELE